MADRQQARSSAQATLSLLQRAVRVRRTYGEGNRIITLIGERLSQKLTKHLRRHGRLEVFVQRGEFTMDGEPVFEPDHADAVAEQLFRDGVRMFSLDGLIDDAGISSFCDLLAEAMSPGADEDVVTLLWGREIKGLHIEAMDFARDACGARTVISPHAVERSLEGLGISGEGPGLDKPAQRRPAGPIALPLSGGLTEQNLDRLRRGVEVLDGLWAYPEAGMEAAVALAGPVLETGEIPLGRSLFMGARRVLDSDAMTLMYTPDRVNSFVEAVPGGVHADVAGCVEVLLGCGPSVLDRLITLHRRALRGDPREGIGRLIAELQRDDPERLLSRFRKASSDEVAPLLGCLVLLHPPTAASELRRRLRPGAEDIVVSLLGAIQEWPQIYSAEVRAASIELSSESGPIRAAAAHLFRLNEDHEAAPTLLYWVQQEGFRGAPQREQVAILRALVRLEGASVTPLLNAMIDPPSKKVTAPMSLRIAAARALGESDDSEAFRVLQRARDAGDPSLADAALRAIARVAGRHRTGRDPLGQPRGATVVDDAPAPTPMPMPTPKDPGALDPEEIAANQRRQQLGATLIVALAAGLRSAKLYDADNQAVGRMVTNLAAILKTLWNELGGELSLLTDEGVFFLGAQRLRFGTAQLNAAKECAAHLKARQLGGIFFTGPPDEGVCRGLLAVLSPPADSDVQGDDVLERYHRQLSKAGAGVVGLLPLQEGLSEADRRPSRARALAAPYSATLNAVSGQLASGAPEVRTLGVRRAGYALVDSCMRDLDGFRHLAGIVPAQQEEAGRVMRVACIALMVAARAGVARRELADVAMSSLLHSVGADAAESSARVAKMLAASVDSEGVEASSGGLLRAVVAWECGPGGAEDSTAASPHPLSSLIALADRLDRSLVSGGDGASQPVLAALSIEGTGAPDRYAQAVAELLGPFEGGAPVWSTVLE